jgi:hypothetical protein
MAESNASKNLKDAEAIQRVLSKKETVANAAWWGFDPKDSTKAIQGAINSGATKVIIPYVGKEWITEPIKLVSNQKIVFEPGVIVTAKKNSFQNKYDCLFSAYNKSNIEITGYGATLRMYREDYKSYKIKSEHRHTLEIRGCRNIKISGLRLEKSGGDGIFIGTTIDKFYLPCEKILIQNCVCDSNYRLGIGVVSVDGLLIENCTVSNTRGTRPASGIDIEPNHAGNIMVNAVISNCTAVNNIGSGFIASISGLSDKSRDVSILFVNCYVKGSTEVGLNVYAKNKTGPKGLVEFKNCTVENTSSSGIQTYWEKDCPTQLRFSNCKLNNVARRSKDTPIKLTLKKRATVSQMEGIKFIDCYLYDNKDRPCLKAINIDNGNGVFDIKGNIDVFNPSSRKTSVYMSDNNLGITFNYFNMQK